MSEITLGKFLNYRDPALVLSEERTRHLYVIGKSGSGKSTLLRNVFLQDVYASAGVCLIDPHGDLALEVLEQIPKHRLNDVLYINLGDLDFPLLWNPLQKTNYLDEYQIAQALTLALKHIWSDSWGARMEYILYNTLFALSAANGSFVMMPKFFANKDFRQEILQHVKDPKVIDFWQREYGQIIAEFPEALMPIENKVGKILSQKSLRNLFSNRGSSFDLRFAMDAQKIIVVNLAKGKIGSETANLFGSMFVSLLGANAMTRQALSVEERSFFSLIIDEFQSFTTESFVSILSEIRKYGVGLTLAHQYSDQLSASIRNAVFGNVAHKVVFAVGVHDAEIFAKEISPYPASVIYELKNYQAFFICGDGFVTRIKTLEPLSPSEAQYRIANMEIIISENRKKFCGKRDEIENKIQKFFKNILKFDKSGYAFKR